MVWVTRIPMAVCANPVKVFSRGSVTKQGGRWQTHAAQNTNIGSLPHAAVWK
jgi:hypothetical protein